MITLVIPDIHLNHEKAERIISGFPEADEVVCLGDYFDDYHDNWESNKKTAKWLVSKLDDPRFIMLMGNHDASYRWLHYRCSGWEHRKQVVIGDAMKGQWEKLRPFYFTQGWFLSHAGLNECFFHPYDGMTEERLQRLCDEAVENALVDTHPIFDAGNDRCGGGCKQFVGGILWQDWSSAKPIPGWKQLCGHTIGRNPRIRETEDGSCIVCIDTRLDHIGIITDGKLEIMAV